MNYMKLKIFELAKLIENTVRVHDMHVALTGGQLYKEGPRKDVDFVLYHVRQNAKADIVKVMQALQEDIPNFEFTSHYGFVSKATWQGMDLDFLYPECEGGEYPSIVVAGDLPVLKSVQPMAPMAPMQ